MKYQPNPYIFKCRPICVVMECGVRCMGYGVGVGCGWCENSHILPPKK